MLTFTVLIIILLIGNAVSKNCEIAKFEIETDNYVAKCNPTLKDTNGKLVAEPLSVCVVKCKNSPLRKVEEYVFSFEAMILGVLILPTF